MVVSDEFQYARGVYEDAQSTLGERINQAWRDMAVSTRRLLAEEPTEARLLLYVLISDIIFFLSWSLKAVVAPSAGAAQHLPVEVSFWLVFALFCRTSAMYGLAILIGCGARAMGGTGSWRDTRAAVFWGALVAAPIGFVFAVVSVIFAAIEPYMPAFGNTWLVVLPYWISVIPFVWFVSVGLAEAHKFTKPTHVFTAISAIGVAGIILSMYLRANGVV